MWPRQNIARTWTPGAYYKGHCLGLVHIIKTEYLRECSAPRTYSTICISCESCLGSLVGFARLPCFGTLRSALSAKVALGELLRLCPGSAGLSTSVEKAKTDHHDEARAGRCSRGSLRVPKDLCRFERGAGFCPAKAWIAPQIRPSEH